MDKEKMWKEISKLQGEFVVEVLNVADKYGENKEEIFCQAVETLEFVGLLFLTDAVKVHTPILD